jgi:hypothetical protein
MSRVSNWIGQSTSTIGVGTMLMDGVIDGYATFSTMGDGSVYYSIVDGNNRESGIGILTGNSIQRTNVKATLVDGESYLSSPAPISLSGGAFAYCTFNKDAFDSLYQQSLSTLAYTSQEAATANTLTPIIPLYSISHDSRLTTLSSALLIAAPTGDPSALSNLTIRLKDNGTARAITYNAIYRAIGVTLPSTTTLGKTMYLEFKYNATDTKWDCLNVRVEA